MKKLNESKIKLTKFISFYSRKPIKRSIYLTCGQNDTLFDRLNSHMDSVELIACFQNRFKYNEGLLFVKQISVH